MIKVSSVWIDWLVDECPDLSYLERTPLDHFGGIHGSNWVHVTKEVKAQVIEKYGSLWTACEHYADEDQQRLQAFHAGEWHMMGCVAKAVVLYPRGNYLRLETFQSGGLWGIENLVDEEYRAEIEADQLAELKAHLEVFGVDVSDFQEKYKCTPST